MEEQEIKLTLPNNDAFSSIQKSLTKEIYPIQELTQISFISNNNNV